MSATRERLREFELAMGGVVADAPRSLSREELLLRVRLQVEETAELVAALCGRDDLACELTDDWFDAAARVLMRRRRMDHEAVAKELADVEYVTHGTAHYVGVNLDTAVGLVHESNMAKADGPVRKDGKRLKPEGWVPPDMRPALVGEGVSERVRRRYREGRW